ncbi:MAG: hypothetical protein EOO36_02670 [Cytophagaceae bacterium]|nr:MAG: hypothetical protein EOO36_02670 [Cytophagaceae bacterium]
MLATSAVIKPTLVLGYTSLRVHFPDAAAVGQPAGLYLKPNVLISAALLGGATINTYATASPTPQESYTLSNSLVGVSTQPSGIIQLTFLPTQAFQEIELVFFSTVALGQDIAAYEAYSTVAPLPLPVVLVDFRAQAHAHRGGPGLANGRRASRRLFRGRARR